MSALVVVGRAAAASRDVVTKSPADTLAATAMTQAQVDSRVASNLGSYAALSYVDSQDALNATKAYADNGDAGRLKLSAKGAANGLAPLDSGAKVPAANLPAATQLAPRQVWSPNAYASGSVANVTSEVTLYTCAVSDPGYVYQVICWGYCETSSTDSATGGAVLVRVGSTGGTTIAKGCSMTRSENWGDCVVLPYYFSANITGATTLYVRASRVVGGGTVTFSNYNQNLYVMTVPAVA